jgi:hypothetical protein
MKKSLLVGLLTVFVLSGVLAAGCTSPIASPTPTSSTQSVSQYLTTVMQERNFTMMTPFAFQPNARGGNAMYNGTASDANGTYLVSVQAWNSTQAAQGRFISMRDMYISQGYATMQQNATMWSGFNASARMGAAVEYGTSPLMPYYVMVITGGAAGQAPFQQTMWQHMLDVAHTPNDDGSGMGQHMGLGMSTSMGSAMLQEMREHMGGNFSTGMMSGL